MLARCIMRKALSVPIGVGKRCLGDKKAGRERYDTKCFVFRNVEKLVMIPRIPIAGYSSLVYKGVLHYALYDAERATYWL